MRRSLILWNNISVAGLYSYQTIIAFVAIFLLFSLKIQAQNCGLDAPLDIDFNSLHSYELEITDVFNDDLSAPDQGVCGVEIRFIHSFVENLELWLESPAGQQIQLIGPNTDDQISTTFFAIWDIAFVPCLEMAEPDLGFEATWNNDQAMNWVNGGQYNGSYYPILGCLEDFNTGPANGTWTLNIANDPSNYAGAILDFRLIFCDNRGQECCFADAGNVPDTLDLLTCIGDTSLVLDFDPIYDNVNEIPDTIEYGYTYAIAQDSILIEFDSTLDFTSYGVGTYQICGISYDREELDSFPTPDGVLNIDSIRNNLLGFEPYFCGRITDSCIIIEILPIPTPAFRVDTLCAGDSLMLGDTIFRTTGIYSVILPSYANCDSVVNLDLTVLEVPPTNLTEIICEGDTLWVGTMPYTQTGTYSDTLNNFFGCDSIVNLDLTVLEPLSTSLTETICIGDDFMVGDSTFNQTGVYQVDLLSSQNCDSIVTLNLTVLDPQAIILGPDTVDCYNPEITLDGGTSTPSGVLDYVWTNLNGDDLGSSATILVNSADTYILWVTETNNGTSCQSSDTLIVVEDLIAPQADAGDPNTLTCEFSEFILGGPNTTQNDSVIYLWETIGGNIIGDNTVLNPTIDAPGEYTLTVTDTTNGCSTTDMVNINIDTVPPIADPGPDVRLDCDDLSLVLDGTNSSSGMNFEYEWISLTGIVPTNANTPTPTVDQADTYQLIVNNTLNGCSDTALVEVTIDTIPPIVVLANPDTLNCEIQSINLNATGSDTGAPFDFYWNIYNGGNISANENSLEPTVNTTGSYEIVIFNQDNACRDSMLIIVTDTITVLNADSGMADTLDCETPEITLDGSGSFGSNDMTYCWSTINGNIVGDSNIVAILVDEPGDYQLLVKDTITQCTATSTIEVIQDESFPIAEAGNQLVLNCRDTILMLDGSASTGPLNLEYTWTGPCIVSDANTPFPTINCAAWYYLTVTNPINACESIDSIEVILNETTPIANAGLPDTLTCVDSTLQLNAGLSTGDDLVFAWSGPGIIDGADSATPNINQAGIYQLILSNANSFCADTATVEIAVDMIPPVIDLVQLDSITCDEAIIDIGGINTSSGSEFEYSWMTTGGSIVGPINESTAMVDSAGVYQFLVTNTRNGCEAFELITVFADTMPPFASAGSDMELTCGMQSVWLQGMSSADGPNISYLWEGDCLLTDPTLDSVLIDCPGFYVIQVINEENGCSSTDTVEVTLDDQTPLAVLPDTAFISCETGNTQLDATGSVNGNLIWYFNGTLTSLSGLMPTITDTGTYTLIVDNPGLACSDTANVLVLLDCQPLIVVAMPDTLTCDTNTVVLDASASSSGSQYTYEWSADDPTCIVNGADTPMPTVRCAGEYTLILTNEAVQLSDSITVTVIATDESPTADAGLPDTLDCNRLMVTLDGSGSFGDNPLDYIWSNFNGDTIGMTAMIDVEMPDVYLLEVTDQVTGCMGVDAVVISANTTVPDISFGNNLVPCEADIITVEAFVDPPGDYFYEWSGPSILSTLTELDIQIDSVGWYYFSVRNNDNGCVTQDSVEIIRQSCGPCVLVASPDSITCDVGTVLLEGSLCEDCIDCDTIWTSDNGVIDAQDGLMATVSAAGIYTLSVTDQEGFVTTVDVEVIENLVDPIADAGPDRNLTCADTTLLLGGNNTSLGSEFSYEWTTQFGNILSANNMPTVEVNGEGMYYLEVRNTGTGCFAQDFVLVGRDTLHPMANAGTNQSLTCDISLLTLDGGGSTFGQNIAYNWSTDDPDCIESGENTVNPFVSCAGIYILTVTDTINGCFDTASVEVILEDELPFIPAIADTVLTCQDTLIRLEVAIDTIGFSVRWCILDDDNDPVLPCLEDSLAIEVDSPGSYLFQLTDNATGCTSSEIVNVTQNIELPTAEAGAGDVFYCSEDSLQLSGAAGPDISILEINWVSENDLPISNPETLTPTIYAPDTYTIIVTNTLNQCTVSDEVIILQDINTPGVEAGTADLLTCEIESVTLSGSGNTMSGSIEYLWTTEQGTILSGEEEPNPIVGSPGMYYLTVLDPDNSCTNMDSVLVESNTLAPSIMVENEDNLNLNCLEGILSLDASGSISNTGNDLEFAWAVNPVGNISSTDPTLPIIEVDEVGFYQLVLTDTFNGCMDTTIIRVGGEFEDPEIVINNPADLTCDREAVQLDATGSSEGDNFINVWTGPSGNSLPDSSLSPTVEEPGLYILIITNTNTGCTHADSVIISLDLNYPNSLIEIPNELDCTISSVLLDGSNSTAGDDIAYIWESMPGNVVSGQGTPIVEVDTSGIYALIVENIKNGCADTSFVEVFENGDQIESIISSVNSPDCIGDINGMIEIESVIGGTPPYTYALDDGFFSTNSSFTSLPAGLYTLHIQDANGCEYETEVLVPEPEEITVDLGVDINVQLGDSTLLQAFVNIPDYESLQWFPTETFDCPDCTEQMVQPMETSTYWVEVRDSNGCKAVDYITVSIAKPRSLYIPSAFSPNGDGRNDVFMIYAGDNVKQINDFKIFDRWGNLVHDEQAFQANDPNFGWDGIFEGKTMNPAVFVFIAEVEYADGWVEMISGDFALIR